MIAHRNRPEVFKVYLSSTEKLALWELARRECMRPSELVRTWIRNARKKTTSQITQAPQACAELEHERIDEWRAARKLRRRRARARDAR